MKSEIIYRHWFSSFLRNIQLRRLIQSGGVEIERNTWASGLCGRWWFIGRKHYTTQINLNFMKCQQVDPSNIQWREHYAYVYDSSMECRKSHRIRTGGRVQLFGTILTNQNGIYEEMKRSLISGNACDHLLKNVLSSRFLSKNTKLNIYLLTYSLNGAESFLEI